jgi:hypothetical protein
MNSNINGSKGPPHDCPAAQSLIPVSKMGILGNPGDMQPLAARLPPASDALTFVTRTRYGLTEFNAMGEMEMSF